MSKQNKQISVFCEIFGNTLRNQILSDILTMQNLKFALIDIRVNIDVSRIKSDEIIKELENEGIIIEETKYGRTQLYTLNEKNTKVALLKQTFNACINYTIDNEIEMIQNE